MKMLPSKHNSETTAYINHISRTNINRLSVFNRKYTKTKYWIEKSDKGHRLCQKSFNSRSELWCKSIIKSGYFPFIAIGFKYSEITKIWIHNNLHESYIREYLEKHIFDDIQLKTINNILEARDLFSVGEK